MINECADEELVYMARSHDDQAMFLLIQRVEYQIEKMAETIVKKQGCYDVEDAWQVARMGCLSAVETYRQDKESSFRNFARLCAEREVRSMVRKERNKGISSHYRSVSLDQVREEEGVYLIDLVKSPYLEYDPNAYMELQQRKNDLQVLLHRFNETEQRIYQMRIQGFTYKEIARVLNINVKRVDNAIQQIKKKIKRAFD